MTDELSKSPLKHWVMGPGCGAGIRRMLPESNSQSSVLDEHRHDLTQRTQILTSIRAAGNPCSSKSVPCQGRFRPMPAQPPEVGRPCVYPDRCWPNSGPTSPEVAPIWQNSDQGRPTSSKPSRFRKNNGRNFAVCGRTWTTSGQQNYHDIGPTRAKLS